MTYLCIKLVQRSFDCVIRHEVIIIMIIIIVIKMEVALCDPVCKVTMCC